MAKIWKESANIDEHPNRNNFDLRYQNHLTMKMGGIYPIMAKECVPGDSFTIDTAFGLKFMPLVFPVQSHMKAHISYFYVPNRILWDNWKNFISGLEEHEHPYISQPTSWFKTGSLCDYMDVPTSTVGNTHKVTTKVASSFGFEDGVWTARPRRIGERIGTFDETFVGISGLYSTGILMSYVTNLLTDGTAFTAGQAIGLDFLESNDNRPFYFFDSPLNLLYKGTSSSNSSTFQFEIEGISANQSVTLLALRALPSIGTVVYPNSAVQGPSESIDNRVEVFAAYSSQLTASGPGFCSHSHSTSTYLPFVEKIIQSQLSGYNVYIGVVLSSSHSEFPSIGAQISKSTPAYFTGRFRYGYDSKVVDSTYSSPFANDLVGHDGIPEVKINALPFRAYEAIYWSYFSNTQNQPFYVNGQPVYNKWNTTTADGADTTDYHLMYRNYEMDFLTSAMPSPQFGVAPLVGMTALGNITIEDENGVSTYHATVDNDGTITKVVATSPTASIDHARTAMNIAQVGMNINDFRATNSFQRFLETTLRKGYRYKDFIMGHHGVDVKQIELDMPVYIGGVSQDVSVNMVSNMTAGQTINDSPVPLGAFAGTANCFGQSQNTITHYCDDYGWIIGVLTVVPDPAYSQLLPKHFLHDKQMSYYFNEFAQNGMQPITYREVAPLTAYQDYLVDNTKLLTDTFGYQRSNYDLCGYTDQVHGLFRTDLKDFLVHRIFEHRPELGTEFLEINPAEVNDIFAYQSPDTDTILGQIIVDIKAKRPVPRVVVPSLGR